MNFKGKTIIVTGATSGIGLEVVKQAHVLGANIMLHCSPNSIDIAKKLTADFDHRVAFTSLDLMDSKNIKLIKENCLDTFGRIDGLVNNAAIFPRNNILTINQKNYQTIFDINVKAPLFLSQEVIRCFLKQKSAGTIVNIGSINAYCGQDDLLAYSMTKGAMMTMTRNLADSLGSMNIRVNQINVGWTHTDKENKVQLENGNQEDWHTRINNYFAPRGTILSPNEVARHVIFWLSDFSAPVNGAIYEVEQYPVIGRNKKNV